MQQMPLSDDILAIIFTALSLFLCSKETLDILAFILRPAVWLNKWPEVASQPATNHNRRLSPESVEASALARTCLISCPRNAYITVTVKRPSAGQTIDVARRSRQ